MRPSSLNKPSKSKDKFNISPLIRPPSTYGLQFVSEEKNPNMSN